MTQMWESVGDSSVVAATAVCPVIVFVAAVEDVRLVLSSLSRCHTLICHTSVKEGI